MIDVVELEQTCRACPAQWEGRTADGRHVYVRYRFGWLQVGVGATLEDAIDDETITLKLGDGMDGFLTYSQLIAATQDQVRWPSRRSSDKQ